MQTANQINVTNQKPIFNM